MELLLNPYHICSLCKTLPASQSFPILSPNFLDCCLDLKISDILMSISSLLNDPNPQDPLNTDAANMYINNKTEFLKTARNMTISSNS